MRAKAHTRDAYGWFMELPTRWADNDLYGHINNVAYYGFFDTAVNRWLIEQAGLDIQSGGQIGVVVHTACNFFAPLSFPVVLEIGLRVTRIGQTSLGYALGVFAQKASKPAAQGEFVHVYVDRQSRRPMLLSAALRQAAQKLLVEEKQ